MPCTWHAHGTHMLHRAVVPVLLLLFGVIEVWWLRRKVAPRHPHAATTLRTMLGMSLGWAFGHLCVYFVLDDNAPVQWACGVGGEGGGLQLSGFWGGSAQLTLCLLLRWGAAGDCRRSNQRGRPPPPRHHTPPRAATHHHATTRRHASPTRRPECSLAPLPLAARSALHAYLGVHHHCLPRLLQRRPVGAAPLRRRGAARPGCSRRRAVPSVGVGAALCPWATLPRRPGDDDHGAVERGALSHRHVVAARGAHHLAQPAARSQRELRRAVRRAAQRHLRRAVVLRPARQRRELQAHPGAHPLDITSHACAHSICMCT